MTDLEIYIDGFNDKGYRAAYYNYYTQNRWGDAHNYDLAINAALGHDACVNMILAAAEAKEKAMEG